ncbi:SDR family oxidoreductase [Listeria cornellensis]|uniref:Putative oxidoreductase n=1 Tax=Listeria cornellensis FSL F6-0969 TaxID=1265820 RepID=W7BKD3_9LIST|nr:SDR family oxidoreductase [Listeria cornellensis]EUJ26322.1 putative oxidoreductase [Listeria cornellensis FSL F6-0969]
MKKNAIILGADGYLGKELIHQDFETIVCIDKNYDSWGIREGNKIFYNANINLKEDRDRLITALDEEGVAIDVLVNLVGVNNQKNFFNITESDWNNTFSNNIKSMVFFLKAIYTLFSEKVAIVNIASQNGVVAHENRIAYGPSKAALIQLTKNLSIDFLNDAKKDIKVNCISPSYILNDSNKEFFQSFEGKKLIKRIPYKKVVTAPDVIEAIMFLISSKSDAIRGQNLIIDYGYTIV